MTPEQKQKLLDFIEINASGFDYFDFELRKAAAAMLADIEAEITPITAEALLAHGWEDYGGGHYFNDKLMHTISEGPSGLWWLTVDLDHVRLNGLKTMYDVRELVRLLGAKTDAELKS